MTAQRRLAAILAADVAGWSRLMGLDEEGTLARLKAHRAAVIDPTLAEHRGRIVKTTGDGLLVEFASVVDAVRCAVEWQRRMAGRNAETPDASQIVFRIGVNLGDIIIDGDDIHGDGVNIAARLEAVAEPGGVVISGTVYDQVRDRLPCGFEDAGEQSMKNIARPVRVWRVRAAQDPAGLSAVGTAPPNEPLALPDRPSIAVLPFQNMSGDPEQEYFADGMVEDIITALSRFKSLFVIARNSSFAWKGKSPDIKQVGRELGVRYVLEGSVRKAAGKVRITAQLITADSGTHLWADRFDGALEDVFELQDRVTSSVVAAVAPKLDQAEIERARRKPVGNLDAYDLYLRGMACINEWTRDSYEEALGLFYRAIEIDPDFAIPHAMAARCYGFRKQQSRIVDKAWEEAEIRRLAARVAVIGQDDALALSWAALPLSFVCRDFAAAAALVDRAVIINPNLAVAWMHRGLLSIYVGRHEDGISEVQRAMRLDPIDRETFRSETFLAQACFFLGRDAEAADWANRALARQPTWQAALRIAAVANAFLGNRDRVRDLVATMRALYPSMGQANILAELAFARLEDIDRYAEGLRLAGFPE